jgi:hypothetical protein
MSDYRNFDSLIGDELTVIRKGFFSPVFEITDGQYCYGKVITNYNKHTFSIIETAKESWRVEREGKIAIKALSIINSNSENIGYIKRLDQVLHLTDGFEALFSTKKISTFSLVYCWYNKQLEVLVKIKQSDISYRKPFKITFEGPGFKQTEYAPFLTLMLTHLTFMAVTRKF